MVELLKGPSVAPPPKKRQTLLAKWFVFFLVTRVYFVKERNDGDERHDEGTI
jgi:hypothetical protein